MNPRKKTLSTVAVIMILATAVLFFTHRPFVAAREESRKPAPVPIPASPAKPASAPDPVLTQAIDNAIQQSGLQQTRVGVCVIALKDGRVLYARDADKLFTPASNMKIYTTAVALDLLGPDYRWRTSVYAPKRQETSGIIDGDLTLYGRGAPDLISKPEGDAPSLGKFADQLYQLGVREVRGNVVGDESYFRGDMFGLGWQWNDLQWYFGAQPSALSLDENSFEVTIAPGDKQGSSARVVLNPNEKFVHLTNNTTTGERDATTTIGIMRDLSGNDLRVWGEFPVAGHAFSAFLSFENPALRAATVFKQALESRGIKVTGEARSRDSRVAENEKFDPQKAVELTYQDSEPLSEIVRRTNKQSNNLFAELLLRTIGKQRGATAPDPDPRKNDARGDDEAGTAVVKAWLAGNSIPAANVAIRDGSGLSRLDLVSPEVTARLLAAMANKNTAAAFHDSLPNAGHDGTLSGRLKNFTGRIAAKTGTLTYVHSLSGYATTLKGETLVFSIMCNDVQADSAAVGLIDKIAASVADWGQAPAK